MDCTIYYKCHAQQPTYDPRYRLDKMGEAQGMCRILSASEVLSWLRLADPGL
jgi:hypothetical protein